MEKKSEGFSEFSIQQAMKLANSDAGRQLYALLQATQRDALQGAMNQAAAGNMDGAKSMIETLMSDPKARQLMEKLRE